MSYAWSVCQMAYLVEVQERCWNKLFAGTKFLRRQEFIQYRIGVPGACQPSARQNLWTCGCTISIQDWAGVRHPRKEKKIPPCASTDLNKLLILQTRGTNKRKHIGLDRVWDRPGLLWHGPVASLRKSPWAQLVRLLGNAIQIRDFRDATSWTSEPSTGVLRRVSLSLPATGPEESQKLWQEDFQSWDAQKSSESVAAHGQVS